MVAMKNPDITDQQIIDCYLRLHSVTKVIKELGIGKNRAAIVLLRNKVPRDGLEIYRKSAECYPQSIQDEILKQHNEGAPIRSLRLQFGGSEASVRQAILRNGGDILPGKTTRKKLNQDELHQILTRYPAGESQMEIAVSLGFDQTVVSRVLAEHGIEVRGFHPRREEHPHWNGGRARHGEGYRLVTMPDDDPMASMMRNRSGYVLEHRLNMARKLGRPLSRHETVHHIDGNKLNNDPDNLQLRQGRHGNGVVMCCCDCGSLNIQNIAI